MTTTTTTMMMMMMELRFISSVAQAQSGLTEVTGAVVVAISAVSVDEHYRRSPLVTRQTVPLTGKQRSPLASVRTRRGSPPGEILHLGDGL